MTGTMASLSEPPYAELGRALRPRLFRAHRPVFITARFRSGSTLLWNLFRHVDGCTAFYEPLNERRWFDSTRRGTRVDRTHRDVDDYWREYEGLDDLGAHYDEEWTRRRLYMDETSWDPALTAYIRLMVERAPGRPGLQFNRVDFRLAWLRSMFPEASLIHLYRHPRDQWCSSLGDLSCCPPSSDISRFREHDGFYLLPWAADLKYRFPFLDVPDSTHPYRLFYFVWKLSYIFGAAFADYSLAFESLVANPEAQLRHLFATIALERADLSRVAALVVPVPSRWKQYASADWFMGHEQACEQALMDFFEPGRSRPVEQPPIGRGRVRAAVVAELVDA